MTVKIFSQVVSQGDSLRYGEQSRGVTRDLRTELNGIGYTQAMGDFIRLDLRLGSIVLAVGKPIVGRMSDYIAAWIEIPKSRVYESAQSIPDWISKLRATNDISNPQEVSRSCLEIENTALPLDEPQAMFRTSSEWAEVGYILYKNADELGRILSNPIQAQYSDCKAVYILKDTPQCVGLKGKQFSVKDIRGAVVLHPPKSEEISKARVGSVFIIWDGKEELFNTPKRFVEGQQIRLKWKHQSSIYEPYEQNVICGQQELSRPMDKDWVWPFQAGSLSVSVLGGATLAPDKYTLTINGQYPKDRYTREELQRGLKIKVRHDKYKPIEKSISVDELERAAGRIEALQFKAERLDWNDIKTTPETDKRQIRAIFINDGDSWPCLTPGASVYVTSPTAKLCILLSDGRYQEETMNLSLSLKPIKLKVEEKPVGSTSSPSHQAQPGPSGGAGGTPEKSNSIWTGLKTHWMQYLLGAGIGSLLTLISLGVLVWRFGVNPETLFGKKEGKTTQTVSAGTKVEQATAQPEEAENKSLEDLLSATTWNKAELESVAPGLYDALNTWDFEEAKKLIETRGVTSGDELLTTLSECITKEVTKPKTKHELSETMVRNKYMGKLKELIKSKQQESTPATTTVPKVQDAISPRSKAPAGSKTKKKQASQKEAEPQKG